ncbi:MAG: glycosyltransferase [Betaproteobacteria bacterium]|nr:glycosyltransferase [Betaproteobacteria bacterium]
MLTIIIPCLNEADGIAETLQALAPLRARGVEVVVVDGGSGDNTVECAKPLADQVMSAARGRALQMNAGAAAARGDILLFLHADCRLPAQADQLITDGLNRARKTWGRFDVELSGERAMLGVIAALMNARSRLTSVSTGDQGLFITRTLFEAAGKFPQIPLMEDIAFTKTLKRYGAPLNLRHRMRVSGRRWEKHGVWRTVLLMWRLRFQYWLGADPVNLAKQYAPHKL